MPALPELQSRFAAAILLAPAVADSLVLDDRLTPAQRLQIYRNHLRITLTEALAATFPVVRRLVGPECFGWLARRFIPLHPPAGPCLFEYGADLADFLSELPELRALPYLPHVARLEWALNEAYHAQDVLPLSVERFAESAGLFGKHLRLVLDPSVRLVASPYPIDRIWQANQPDQELVLEVELDSGPVRLLVQRQDVEVFWRPLRVPEHVFLQLIETSRTLGEAVTAALAIGPFDAQGQLERLLQDKAFADLPAPLPKGNI
jgi:hypothetical protein